MTNMRPGATTHTTFAAGEATQTLRVVLEMIRSGAATTRSELVSKSGLGRKLITQRVEELIERGLVVEGSLAPSTGGRSARQLHFRNDAGHLLVAELGNTSISVGLTDLDGHLLAQHEEAADIMVGPETILSRVEELFDQLLADRTDTAPPLWAIGIGVLGPVDADAGSPLELALRPGWGGYALRKRLVDRFDIPVWVDNEVNLMALGEFRDGMGRGIDDLVFVKIGSGIGAGLISGGRLCRGANGSAGQIGHIQVVEDALTTCWCGSAGCVTLLAGGLGLAHAAERAARNDESPLLAQWLSARGSLDAKDVAAAAARSDPTSVALLTRAGRLVGRALTATINVINPSLVLIGGGVAHSGDLLLAAIREEVYRTAYPSATRDLRIAFSPLSDAACLVGAAFMAVDELLSSHRLGRWIDAGTPTGLAAEIHG
jgi:glucokinase-like ROK family protein